MGVRSRRSTKRRRAATVSVRDRGGGGMDFISGLNDDLLLRILNLVPDTENVVRTHALSRRWRGLWTGVTALRFDFNSRQKSCGSDASTERFVNAIHRFTRFVLPLYMEPAFVFCRSDAAAERYIAFLNGVLALRATAAKEPAFIEDLAISFDIGEQAMEQLVPLSVEAAQGWIRYALQHVVKSFIFRLRLPWGLYDMDRNDYEHPVMILDEMDNYPKMEIMHLRLCMTELGLPSSTLVFPFLVDLSLKGIVVPDGGVNLLSRLVSSSCCPRLQKLHLGHLNFVFSTMAVIFRIEADTLLELSLESLYDMQFLELMTPSLRVLHIVDSFDLNGFTVSVPRLENLRFWVQRPLHIDDVHGHLSNVGTLKIQIFSHGETQINAGDRNDGTIHILQCCRSIRCLEVYFEIPKTEDQTVDIINGRIPLLPYVTDLAVHIKLRELHSTGPGIECLLGQCRNIKYFSLQLNYIIMRKNLSVSDNNTCHWRSHEFQFIESILMKAVGIQKAIISFSTFYWWQKGRKHALKKLIPPPLDGGLWTICKDKDRMQLSYKWRRL